MLGRHQQRPPRNLLEAGDFDARAADHPEEPGAGPPPCLRYLDDAAIRHPIRRDRGDQIDDEIEIEQDVVDQ